MESERTNFAAVTTFEEKSYIDLTAELKERGLKEGEVLIKVMSCPINPSDQLMSEGQYGLPETFQKKEYGYGVGFEGAGQIVEVHESVPSDLVGKKVAFSNTPGTPYFQGTWRQYIVLNHQMVFQYPDDMDFDLICSTIVNPLTVCGFIDTYNKGGHKAMIHDAACSALGKMLVKTCKKHSIPLINIVRRAEQVKTLEELGAENILNSSLETFENDLKEAIAKLQPTIFFDAIGGKITGQVLNLMPEKSTAYVYGLLSGEEFSFSCGGIIFSQKTLTSFWLSVWLPSLTAEERTKWVSEVIGDLQTGGEVFGSKVYKTFPLSKFKDAMKEALDHASEGKVILKPHEE
uniref:Enoyl reductase (ER) domain-containing protein n=2 Tax=Euplotes harpa TaxID=151035 RepID=A0A7S3N9P1_9SPIT|mmetsp:Transcript_26990/g.31152  ORF Transcript_26990/g.31152 Transcript_26990/m.31152 type:complete len:347 (+) Transcript_26990:23-1063(+)|eukprot:CAMPEP_0168337422 /NCGR_PEP_ID=MMETSP0213-20121227/12176_1 /TAXON_ID=151035 /ORGANISM="Euplotes harpa, Strain FSP1.4" /LENGTH=346 /DNA_ID=CAMNT_0008342899 /DNA_START=8 /DNA_END=1048 /DNA_ORIENTATION=+